MYIIIHVVLTENQVTIYTSAHTHRHTQDHRAKISPLGHLTRHFLSEKPQKQSHAPTQRPTDYQAVINQNKHKHTLKH